MVVLTEKKDIAAFASENKLHIALGCFDGVHLGHQALFDLVAQCARRAGEQAGVLLFDPHPEEVLRGDGSLMLLTALAEKIRLIQTYGKLHVIILPFTMDFAAISPEDFVREYLAGLLKVRTAVCGYNYRFGYKGQGDSYTFRQLAVAYGFAGVVKPRVTVDGKEASSTAIRNLIRLGDMLEAYSRLGHCHIYSGEVVEGHKLGAQLGFPTANLKISTKLILPAFGVYGAFIRDAKGGIYRAVVNVGVRPTVSGGDAMPSFEANLLDFQGDLYGQTLQAVLTNRLRPEMTFEDLSALQNQITHDADTAASVLRQWEAQLQGKGLTPEAIFSCFIQEYPL